MFRWFKDMSLKKKLYIVFGILIAVTVIGIVIGQIVFSRVQIGGRFYAQIEQNMIVADDVAKLRVNMTLVRSRLLTMMIEKDKDELKDHKDTISDLTERIDEIFGKVEKALKESDLTEASSLIAKAKASWSAFKETRDKELIPLIMQGSIDKAKELATGIQAERYNDFLSA
ncbi:MAG: MCP four helix bundle domain-containing protein, partial [Nitrospirae bacterium]|nr:MCP four helix bundle domain-containing protein [Nitrospirota bacterium]